MILRHDLEHESYLNYDFCGLNFNLIWVVDNDKIDKTNRHVVELINQLYLKFHALCHLFLSKTTKSEP
jgi:hypothetical protein